MLFPQPPGQAQQLWGSYQAPLTCHLVLLEVPKSKFIGFICKCQIIALVTVLTPKSSCSYKISSSSLTLHLICLTGGTGKKDPRKYISQDGQEVQQSLGWFYFLSCAQNKLSSSH